MTNMIQVKLTRRREDNTIVDMVTWVDYDKKLNVGSGVRLKGSDEWWRVEEIYDVVLDRETIESNRNWDNNNYEKHDGTAMKNRK